MNFDELQQYFNVLKYDLSVIRISETCLNDNNADLYDLVTQILIFFLSNVMFKILLQQF